MKSYHGLINTIENIVLNGKSISSDNIGVENFATFLDLKTNLKKTNSSIKSNKTNFKKLISALYDVVLTIKPKRHKFNIKQRRHIKAVKLNAVARILLGLGARFAANDAYLEVYKTAIKINNPLLIFQSADKLRKYYSSTLGDKKQAEFYFNECNISLKRIEFELKASHYYNTIYSNYVKSRKVDINTIELTKRFLKELNSVSETNRTALFSYCFHNLWLIHFESNHDYFSLVDHIKKAISYFESNFPKNINELLAFNGHLCQYLIRIESYSEANKQIEYTLNITMKNGVGWLIVNRFKTLYLLKIKEFNNALEHSKEIINSKAFKSSNRELELWIDSMHKYSIVCLAFQECNLALLSDLNLARFMNSIPEHDADKQAMNIPTIILQILYYILKRDYDKLEAKFDAINKYLNRYVKSDDLFRSFSFIKMLMQVHRRNFHPVAIDRHTQKYQKNLASIPYIKSREPIEIEFVKYEDLWELIMTFLKKDTRKSRLRSNKN